MLDELGFGLDLSECAATGARSDLAYVSPKSGRAVSRSAGEPWRDKMLALPAFLLQTELRADTTAIEERVPADKLLLCPPRLRTAGLR